MMPSDLISREAALEVLDRMEGEARGGVADPLVPGIVRSAAAIRAMPANKRIAELEHGIVHLYDGIDGCSNHGCQIRPIPLGGMGTTSICQCCKDGVKMQQVLRRVESLRRLAREAKPDER